MNIKRTVLIWIIVAVSIFSFSGCGNFGAKARVYKVSDYEVEDPSQLDSWQINVLKAKGLPTDHSKLDIGQRDSIERMGMMHRYLVDKYGIEFEYAGYYRAGFGQKEELIVMPEGADKNDSRSLVSVKVKDGLLSDTYGNYDILMHIEKMYDDYARDYFGSDKVKVFAWNVNNNELGEIDFDNINTYDFKLGVSSVVFISSEICDKDKCETFAKSMLDYSQKHELAGTCRITLVKDVDINKLTNDNCSDYYIDEYMISDCQIISDQNRADFYEGN